MSDKKLPTVDIHGKEYVLVKDRILAFHEEYSESECSIETEVTINGDSVLAKATVTIPGGKFTGHSEAIRATSKGITGQSPVEVAETSAVGRALGMLGIGILESVASADEIRKAPSGDQPKAHASAALNAPKCEHGAMELKVTKKAGPNLGREFWSCTQPMGKKCANGFKWADEVESKEPIIDQDGDTIIPAGEFGEPVSNDNLPF